MTDPDAMRRRRNLAIGLALAGFVVLVFFITMSHLRGTVLVGPH